MQHALAFYLKLGEYLQGPVVKPVEIIKLHRSYAAAEEWLHAKEKKADVSDYIDDTWQPGALAKVLHCGHGGMVIKHALQVQSRQVLTSYRNSLLEEKALVESRFTAADFSMYGERIFFNNEEFSDIVYCEGVMAMQNAFFSWVPFKPAKGECLLIEIPDLPQHSIYNKGIQLLPLGENMFWAGATNAWDDLSENITLKARTVLENQLLETVKTSYTIHGQMAAVRPTVKDRTPVVGRHPTHKNVFILNGLGTKGLSLAPFYANMLLQHILTHAEIPAAVNVLRFAPAYYHS
jgi:glycine/D-amino acid oxidase-like deaminating enzyme